MNAMPAKQGKEKVFCTSENIIFNLFFCKWPNAKPDTKSKDDRSPGVDFINVFCAAFLRVDPKIVKWYWQLNWNLMLSGSAHIKAVQRTLMKLTPAILRSLRESYKVELCQWYLNRNVKKCSFLYGKFAYFFINEYIGNENYKWVLLLSNWRLKHFVLCN